MKKIKSKLFNTLKERNQSNLKTRESKSLFRVEALYSVGPKS